MGSTIARNPGTVYNASEGDKFNADSTLEVVGCPTCGITYAIPASLVSSARRWHGDRSVGWQLCCPLGHTWWYVGETEKEKLKRQLKSERDHTGRLRSQLDQSEAHGRAMRGVATRRKNELDRVTKRVAAGVCPCCNRTFQNLARHMKTNHPHEPVPAP